MKLMLRTALAAATIAGALCAASAGAEDAKGKSQSAKSDRARPAHTDKNLPSDTGVQVRQPAGAVTGAGQPQGTTPQKDVGATGGLEERARAKGRTGKDTKRQ